MPASCLGSAGSEERGRERLGALDGSERTVTCLGRHMTGHSVAHSCPYIALHTSVWALSGYPRHARREVDEFGPLANLDQRTKSMLAPLADVNVCFNNEEALWVVIVHYKKERGPITLKTEKKGRASKNRRG